jgi:hypothetical protein
MTDAAEPYYAKHKVTELTCPHCGAILTFLVNEKDHSVYSCNCGRWLKAIDWQVSEQPAKWSYEPKADYL